MDSIFMDEIALKSIILDFTGIWFGGDELKFISPTNSPTFQSETQFTPQVLIIHPTDINIHSLTFPQTYCHLDP